MLGENLKKARRQKGLSQEALALQLHVVRQTVSKWEQGQSAPDAGLLANLAEVLGVSANELLGTQTDKEEGESINSSELIARQLSKLNAYLQEKRDRRERLWRKLRIVILSIILLTVLILTVSAAA